MPSDVLLYEKKDHIAYITLNRPEVLNALNLELRTRLEEAFADFEQDNTLFVGIVTGAGERAFSTGMDLKERAARDAAGERGLRVAPEAEVTKPLIAAINGYCVAGGLERALRCDIRIATPKSQFGLPEPRWNILAGYGLINLSRMIPLGEALYIQLTGSRIDAERALRNGLIQEIVPEERLMQRAEEIANDVILCSPLAVQAIKKVVMKGRSLPLEGQRALAQELGKQTQNTEDAIEGPRAFAEKRRPQWKMR